MKKLYDTILVLAGENLKTHPRSRRAIEIFREGRAGSIFVTGGHGGFSTNPAEKTNGEYIYEYLLEQKIPENKVYCDNRSLDTLGNFTFPIIEPQQGNPKLSDLDSLLLITEKEHMERAVQYATKVLDMTKVDCDAPTGEYRPDIITRMYNKAILKALGEITTPKPQDAHTFLLEQHPFYQEGWFDKSIRRRQIELGIQCLQWLIK